MVCGICGLYGNAYCLIGDKGDGGRHGEVNCCCDGGRGMENKDVGTAIELVKTETSFEMLIKQWLFALR